MTDTTHCERCGLTGLRLRSLRVSVTMGGPGVRMFGEYLMLCKFCAHLITCTIREACRVLPADAKGLIAEDMVERAQRMMKEEKEKTG